MAYFMNVDMQQALQEARDERDAALAMAVRDGRRADELAVSLYDVTQRLEYASLDVAALKEEVALKNAVIANLQKQLGEQTLQAQAIRDEATRTLATTLRGCKEKMTETNAARVAAETGLNLMTQAYVNLNNAFHEVSSRSANLATDLQLEQLRHGNAQSDLTDMWADLKQAREDLRVKTQELFSARNYIENVLPRFTANTEVTIALLEHELRSRRS